MSRPVSPNTAVPAPTHGTLSRSASQRVVDGGATSAQGTLSRSASQRIVDGATPAHHTHTVSRTGSQRIVSTSSRPVSHVGDGTGIETTDDYSGAPHDRSSVLSHGTGPGDEHPMDDAASGLQRSNSQMSESATAVPSPRNTLKKKASIRGTGSVKRTGSKKSNYASSVRSMQLGEKEKYEPSEEHNSAFYCPVPISGSPTDLLADRFQGKEECVLCSSTVD